MDIVVATEEGQETTEDLAEHLGRWHGWRSGREWDIERLTRVHDTEHRNGQPGSDFDYHGHPVER